MVSAIGLELDVANDRAWLVERSFGPTSGAVLEVDLSSGSRTVVSGPGVGSGPWPEFQSWASRVPGTNLLLIPCYLEDLVLGVDLATGDRRIVSDPSLGLGAPWENVWDVAAAADGRAWVGSSVDGRLFGVDVSSGVHAEVAPSAVPSDRDLFDLELDAANGRLLVADDLRSAILSMDLDDDALEVLVRSSIGSGAPFRRALASGTAVDRAGRAWVIDNERGELVSVELATGARMLVSGSGAGSGPEFIQPMRVGVDASSGTVRVIVMDTGLGAVVEVDVDSGARTILSGPGVGSGPPLNVPSFSGVSMDVAGGAAWVIDGVDIYSPENRVVRVDLATGARTIVSGDGVGVGPKLVDAHGVALDLAGGRALTFSLDALIAVDVSSGDRSVFSSDAVGAGPSYGKPVLLEWDAVEQRALVYGRLAGITTVNGASGDRQLLAKSDEAKGAGLAWPLSMDLWRPTPDAAPLLVVGDHELTALEVVDLARDPFSGEVPAARTIVTR